MFPKKWIGKSACLVWLTNFLVTVGGWRNYFKSSLAFSAQRQHTFRTIITLYCIEDLTQRVSCTVNHALHYLADHNLTLWQQCCCRFRLCFITHEDGPFVQSRLRQPESVFHLTSRGSTSMASPASRHQDVARWIMLTIRLSPLTCRHLLKASSCS